MLMSRTDDTEFFRCYSAVVFYCLQIAIELGTAKLNNEALWYRLRHHEEASSPMPKNNPPVCFTNYL